MKKKILPVSGTRPEAIKMVLLVEKPSKNDAFSCFGCVTGPHREMPDQVLRAFEVTPDVDLNVMKPGQNMHDRVAATTAVFFAQSPMNRGEAGPQSHDLMAPWPAEARPNLLQERAADSQVVVTDNSVIDTALPMRDRIQIDTHVSLLLSDRLPFLDETERLGPVTGHRRDRSGQGMETICEALNG